MKKLLIVMLVIVMALGVFALVGCKETPTRYIAEEGSAGAAYLKSKGFEYTAAQAQRDCFTEILAGTSDIAIIDSVMAGYYVNMKSSSFYGKLKIEDIDSEAEVYAIGFRKDDAALTNAVNSALYTLQEEGKINEIAEKYGLKDVLEAIPAPQSSEATDDSLTYIKGRNKLIVGYTLFAPIAYEENGKLIGFDTELAEAVCAKLGVEVEFQEIEWAQKETELAAKNIDAVWNGFTVTEERKETFSFSSAYLKNKQVAVSKI